MQLKVNETGELFSDKLKAYTLELVGYNKMKEEDCKTRIDYWLYNLSNMENMTTAIPFQQQQPIFGKVGSISELIHMTPEEREKYNISIDSYRTNLSAMKNEREDGVEEGLKRGLEKGRAEGERNVNIKHVKAMIAKGLSPEQIADLLDLDVEFLKSIL